MIGCIVMGILGVLGFIVPIVMDIVSLAIYPGNSMNVSAREGKIVPKQNEIEKKKKKCVRFASVYEIKSYSENYEIGEDKLNIIFT